MSGFSIKLEFNCSHVAKKNVTPPPQKKEPYRPALKLNLKKKIILGFQRQKCVQVIKFYNLHFFFFLWK